MDSSLVLLVRWASIQIWKMRGCVYLARTVSINIKYHRASLCVPSFVPSRNLEAVYRCNGDRLTSVACRGIVPQLRCCVPMWLVYSHRSWESAVRYLELRRLKRQKYDNAKRFAVALRAFFLTQRCLASARVAYFCCWVVHGVSALERSSRCFYHASAHTQSVLLNITRLGTDFVLRYGIPLTE